ncbi:hypothetical protein ACFVGY_08520 [Streptomyces sp. NPDC127106]|uniref:hypothetical protein n=1 Tax=Streptomyces sp. NPDC127106 TaxID=3345360 RepID=UPI00363E713E
MTAEAHETTFRERADRKRTLGVFLLIAAGAIWLWLAYQLLAPFTVNYGSSRSIDCASPVFYDEGDGKRRSYAATEGERCATERDPADLLVLLTLSVPLAAAGTFHYARGTVALDLRRHEDELAQLRAERKG